MPLCVLTRGVRHTHLYLSEDDLLHICNLFWPLNTSPGDAPMLAGDEVSNDCWTRIRALVFIDRISVLSSTIKFLCNIYNIALKGCGFYPRSSFSASLSASAHSPWIQASRRAHIGTMYRLTSAHMVQGSLTAPRSTETAHLGPMRFVSPRFCCCYDGRLCGP